MNKPTATVESQTELDAGVRTLLEDLRLCDEPTNDDLVPARRKIKPRWAVDCGCTGPCFYPIVMSLQPRHVRDFKSFGVAVRNPFAAT